LSVLPLVHGLALDLLRALLRAGRHHLVSVERLWFLAWFCLRALLLRDLTEMDGSRRRTG
jgi:hypothetical protein